MKAVTALILGLTLAVQACPPAGALQQENEVDQHQPPVPTEDDSSAGESVFSAKDRPLTQGDVTVSRTAGFVVTVPAADPVVGASVGVDRGVAGVDGGEVVEGVGDGCLEREASEYNEEGDFYYTGVCAKWWVCGAERVDDVVTGDIAGEGVSGRYQAFLGEMIGYFGADVAPADNPVSGVGSGDVDTINDFLLRGGLGDRRGDGWLPVFYWCAGQDRDGVFDPVDVASVSFGWDLTVGEVYDVPGVRASLYGELLAVLDLYEPRVGLVPPVEGGYTFVQWPTWFFLENPLEEEHVFTTNSIDTFRVDLRAMLLGVQWSFGGEVVAECAVDDMMRFDSDWHHPIDDLPACHHVFSQLATGDLTTTIRYRVEEQVRRRDSSTLDEYPDVGWSDYLGSPTVIELSTTLAGYEVHPIVSVNVAMDSTVEDLRQRAANTGTPGG